MNRAPRFYWCSRCGRRSWKDFGFDIGFWQTRRGLICGNVIGYDRMNGSKYCHRKLRECNEQGEIVGRKPTS